MPRSGTREARIIGRTQCFAPEQVRRKAEYCHSFFADPRHGSLRLGTVLDLPAACGPLISSPVRGRVEIAGTDVTALPSDLRRIGMVFQDFLLFPHRTVAENIAFPLKMQGRSSSEQKEQLQWILGFIRMQELGDRFPHQLSGGQKQRVALARGLIARPELLLLDEPLANLDRELRKEMEVEVRRYQEELGIPFVYVTHNQEEVLTMSDRMAAMHRGALEQAGPKLDVYNAPGTRFVASFVGAPNKLIGRATEIENGRSIQFSNSKKRMKLDFPEPFDPIRTLVSPNSDSSTSAKDLNPRIRTDSSTVFPLMTMIFLIGGKHWRKLPRFRRNDCSLRFQRQYVRMEAARSQFRLVGAGFSARCRP